jgi:hypothetical protein
MNCLIFSPIAPGEILPITPTEIDMNISCSDSPIVKEFIC